MARIQILPLPPVKAGEYEQTPFILILDQMAGEQETWHGPELEYLKAQTGASLVIVHEGTFEAPGQLELTNEQRETLASYLTQPLRIMLGVTDGPTEAQYTPTRTPRNT